MGTLFGLMVTDLLVFIVTLLCALAGAILVGSIVARVRRRRALAEERASSVPLVVFAPRASTSSEAMPRRPFSAPVNAPPPPPPADDEMPPEHSWPTPAYVSAGAAAYGGSGGGNGAHSFDARPDLMEGRTVRFYRPPEGTLQMLPGRLEIVEGEDRGHAIRFVKMRPGAQQITFGRREGSPYEHIQLRSLTVSRQHARLDFEHGRWGIVNLSETNPVTINGELLAPGAPARALLDDDRIEMGEVVFRFKER